MAVWDAETITRFSNQGEDIFADDFRCIIERVALDITPGVSEYLLSDSVLDVRKITWLGISVDAKNHRRFREEDLPLSSSSGTPRFYIFNNLARNTIKFYPTPSVTITTASANLYGSEIINRVIVEYYRTPDYAFAIIPPYFRRRMLKAYVLKLCFGMESKGQNLKASQYFDKKWEFLKETYGQLIYTLVNRPRRLITSSIDDSTRRISNLRLPANKFGISVDI